MFYMLSKTLLLTLALASTSTDTLEMSSQDMPSIACPDKFQYRSTGDKYFGKITIYGALVPSIKVEALFSQQKPISTSFSDRLTLIESLPITEGNLQRGFPITYRVDFPDPHLLPKLIQIKVNDRTICSAKGLREPNTIFTMQHTFYPSLKTLNRPTQPTHLLNPFNNGSAFNSFNPLVPTSAPASTFAKNCGLGDSSLPSFVFGGDDFERGRFPWLAAIFLRNRADLTLKCGGSLISTSTVITSAQCFYFGGLNISANQIVVHLGRHNFYAWEIGAEERDVEAIIIHPDFDGFSGDAQIALLHMESPVSFTQFIRPICLWSSVIPLSNEVGYVATWGSRNLNFVGSKATPRVFEVAIVNENECLRSSNGFLNFTSPRTFCAERRSESFPCFSVFGSGFMFKHAGNWILRAILTSFVGTLTNNTCDIEKYIVYCDLSKHITWVRRNMRR